MKKLFYLLVCFTLLLASCASGGGYSKDKQKTNDYFDNNGTPASDLGINESSIGNNKYVQVNEFFYGTCYKDCLGVQYYDLYQNHVVLNDIYQASIGFYYLNNNFEYDNKTFRLELFYKFFSTALDQYENPHQGTTVSISVIDFSLKGEESNHQIIKKYKDAIHKFSQTPNWGTDLSSKTYTLNKFEKGDYADTFISENNITNFDEYFGNIIYDLCADCAKTFENYLKENKISTKYIMTWYD